MLKHAFHCLRPFSSFLLEITILALQRLTNITSPHKVLLTFFKLIYKKLEPHALVHSLVDEQDYKSILVKLTAHV